MHVVSFVHHLREVGYKLAAEPNPTPFILIKQLGM